MVLHPIINTLENMCAQATFVLPHIAVYRHGTTYFPAQRMPRIHFRLMSDRETRRLLQSRSLASYCLPTISGSNRDIHIRMWWQRPCSQPWLDRRLSLCEERRGQGRLTERVIWTLFFSSLCFDRTRLTWWW